MRPKTIKKSVLHAAEFALIFCAAASLCGCGAPGRIFGLTSLPVESDSPIAQDVIAASRQKGAFPRFADIPKAPTDVRPISAWRSSVTEIQKDKADVMAESATLPPAASDTEAFAAAERGRATSSSLATPAPADSAHQTEAYAEALRERATLPPSSK